MVADAPSDIPLDQRFAEQFYAGNPSRRFELGGGMVLERFGRWPAGEVELPAVDCHRISIHVQEDGNRAPSRWVIDGRPVDVELQPSLIMAVPAGHSLKAFWGDTASGTLNFHFHQKDLEEIVDTSGIRAAQVELQAGRRGLDPHLLTLATHLSRELRHQGLGSLMMRDALKLQMLVHICRTYSSAAAPILGGDQPSRGLRPAALADVLDYMDAHLAEPISLETLADLAHVSRFHFSRLFKKSVGRSPIRELQRRRVERAKTLIRRDGRWKSLAAIAAECGFADQSHLGRAFKKVVGVTPGAFRLMA